MAKKILVSGGAVFSYLDSVKIITNRFRGGLMASLAEDLLSARADVIYLASKESQMPFPQGEGNLSHFNVVCHDGLDDYREKVSQISKVVDAVILGAAVANLIPQNKIQGKFPSHNYKPGDVIPINFTIAPRVIDEVKKANPKVHLFGFKLLSHVSHDELIRAAYGVLLESKANTIFANDTDDLNVVYAVTKDRSVHQMHRRDIHKWIMDRIHEEYYETAFVERDPISISDLSKFYDLIEAHKGQFVKTPEGYVFGSVAVRLAGNSFITTQRGKNELEGHGVVIKEVDHSNMKIFVMRDGDSSYIKASLNAPLFGCLFGAFENIDHILHFHDKLPGLTTHKYATPGTNKDSMRIHRSPSFNIEGHGCILCYDKEGKLLI